MFPEVLDDAGRAGRPVSSMTKLVRESGRSIRARRLIEELLPIVGFPADARPHVLEVIERRGGGPRRHDIHAVRHCCDARTRAVWPAATA